MFHSTQHVEKKFIFAGSDAEGIEEVDQVGGTALRLLHQLSASLPAAEAISRATPTAAMPFLGAMAAWGLAGSVLALETIKRAIVMDNLSRDLLIGPLLSMQFLQKLLNKLDWQQGDHDDQVCRSLEPLDSRRVAIKCSSRRGLCIASWRSGNCTSKADFRRSL